MKVRCATLWFVIAAASLVLAPAFAEDLAPDVPELAKVGEPQFERGPLMKVLAKNMPIKIDWSKLPPEVSPFNPQDETTTFGAKNGPVQTIERAGGFGAGQAGQIGSSFMTPSAGVSSNWAQGPGPVLAELDSVSQSLGF